MKPPPRKRTKRELSLEAKSPDRERDGGLSTWSRQEQRRLLNALKKLSTRPSSQDPLPDLDPELVSRHLGTRSPEEVQSVLEAQKEKLIQFAKNKLISERREDKKRQKPIEMWLQVASTVTGDVEESLSSALTQVLTVASTEPCTLRNSDPPQDQGPVTLLSKGNPLASAVLAPASVGSSPSRAPPAQPPVVPAGVNQTLPAQQQQPHSTARHASAKSAASTGTEVNFERLYQYLSVLHKPGEKCQLTPVESAIVLDLLMTLPEELLLLDCNKLVKHLTQVYGDLTACANSRRAKDFFRKLNRPSPTAAAAAAAAEPHTAPDGSGSQTVSEVKPHPPLNPFLIPVSLLSRKEPSQGNNP